MSPNCSQVPTPCPDRARCKDSFWILKAFSRPDVNPQMRVDATPSRHRRSAFEISKNAARRRRTSRWAKPTISFQRSTSSFRMPWLNNRRRRSLRHLRGAAGESVSGGAGGCALLPAAVRWRNGIGLAGAMAGVWRRGIGDWRLGIGDWDWDWDWVRHLRTSHAVLARTGGDLEARAGGW